MSDTTESQVKSDVPEPVEDDVIEVRIVRQQKPVRIMQEDGTVKNCTLREMVGPEKDHWLNFVQKRTITQNGQPVGMSEYKGMEAKLISMCLFDEEGNKVKEDVIDKWPATAKGKLFRQCQKMNGLIQEGVDQAKNS